MAKHNVKKPDALGSGFFMKGYWNYCQIRKPRG